jgi:hypothetical protein
MGDRHRQVVDEFAQFVRRLGQQDAAAGVDQRVLRVAQFA